MFCQQGVAHAEIVMQHTIFTWPIALTPISGSLHEIIVIQSKLCHRLHVRFKKTNRALSIEHVVIQSMQLSIESEKNTNPFTAINYM